MENRIIQLLLIIGTFLAALLPTWGVFETFNKQVPQKSLSISTTIFSPKESLGTLNDRLEVNYKIGDKIYANMMVINARIENTGINPISDSDIKIPLSVSVNKNWEIVGIGDVGSPTDMERSTIKWERVSDTSYIAKSPFLLNAKEATQVAIYVSPRDGISGVIPEINPFWDARILGLDGLKVNAIASPTYTYTTPETSILKTPISYMIILDVILFFILLILILVIYFYLLSKTKHQEIKNFQTIHYIIVICIFSVLISEVCVSYIGRNFYYNELLLYYSDIKNIWIHLFNLFVIFFGALFGFHLINIGKIK